MGVRTKVLAGALLVSQLVVVGATGSPAGAQLVPGPARISGAMTSGTWQAENATVVVVDAGTRSEVARTGTDATGSYDIAGLAYGTYELYALAPLNTARFWHADGFVDPDVDDPTDIVLSSSARSAVVDLDFPTGGFGGVITGENGPLASPATATFDETTTGFSETVPLEADGQFGLGYIPFGEYQVTARWGSGRSHVFATTVLTDAVNLGSIALSVPAGTGTIGGTVLTDGPVFDGDADAYPIVGATVTVVDAATDATVATALTDDLGSYSIGDLPLGSYRLHAVAPGNASRNWLGSAFGGPAGSPTIVLDETDPSATGLEFVFPNGGFGGYIAGPTGPLVAATATFTDTVTGYSETAAIDANGNFGLGYIPTGEYTITVDHGVSYRRSYTFPSTYTTDPRGLSVALTVPLAPGVVSGVVETGGYLASDATVTLVDPSTGDDVASARTGPDGAYTIADVELGTYWAYALAPGNSTPYWLGDTFDGPVAVSPVEIELTDLAPVASTTDFDFPTGGFGGTIVGARGPLQLARATFTHASGVSETVYLDPFGNFGVGYLPLGDYTLTVEWIIGRSYTFPDPIATGPTGASLSLEVPLATGAITGTITTGDNPVPGAVVGVVPDGQLFPTASTLTDELGNYVIDDLEATSYSVFAVGPGNTARYWDGAGYVGSSVVPAPTTTVTALGPPPVVDLDFPTGGFGGFVTGPTGPLFNAWLSVRNVTTGLVATTTVQPNGNFGIGYLPTGEYEITVNWDWSRSYTFPETYVTGDTGLSVSLQVPSQVSGTVTTPTGDPIAGATVVLVNPFWLLGGGPATMSGADGSFRFPGEYWGDFYLYVQAPNDGQRYWFGTGFDDPATDPVAATLQLRSGSTAFLPIVLPTGGFGGWITGEAATVGTTATFALVGSTYQRTVPVEPTGSFGVGWMPEGEYTITVNYVIGGGFVRSYTFPGTFVTGPTGLSISLTYPVPPVAPATLRGVVRNPDLSPADGARVRVLGTGDIEVAETLSEPDGTYVVTVAPGTYRVLATQGTSAVDVPSVFLDEGATVVQDLVMASAVGLGVVQGVVVDADGVPFESGSVFVQCADGTSRSLTLTNGELNTEIPTATTCTAQLSSMRSLDHFGYLYSASIGYPIIPLTTGTNQTWQIPTATITVNVVDGDGTDIEVQQVSNNVFINIPPPPGTPPGSIYSANSGTSIGFPMGMGGNTITPAPYTLPTLRATNNNLTVRLPDGRTYQRTIDTTTGNTVVDIVVEDLALAPVQGTVVDADGVPFESGSVFVQCADGTSRSVSLTNGELNTEIPTATTCVARFTNFDTLDHFGTSYSTSIGYPIIPLTAGTNQTWQIPTATITLNVVDGDGTDVEIQQVTNNTYTFIPPPPGTPPGFINDASANTSIGQPMGMPGGPTITPAPYTLPTLRATNNNLTVRLPDGRTYQRTIDTTTGNTVIELIVAGQTPIWIVSAAGEEVFDGDGVADSVEAQVPSRSGVAGDGNGDGIPDYRQQDVASLPSSAGNYVTFAVAAVDGSPTTDTPVLQNVLTFDPIAGPPTLPPGATYTPPPAAFVLPEGLASFQVADITPGATKVITIFVEDTTGIDGYAKVDNNGNWAIMPSEAEGGWPDRAVVFDDRVEITLSDGGPFDADEQANGVIVDPGGIVRIVDATPPTITCPPETHYLLNQTGVFATASVTDDGLGVASPTVTLPVDTSRVGEQQLLFEAVDLGGLSVTKECPVTVGYRFGGIRPPLSSTAVNRVKAGSNVPVKWNITDAAGVGISDPASFERLTLRATGCDASSASDDIQWWELTTGSGLKYLGDGNWQYNWKSAKSLRGCFDLEIHLADSPHPIVVEVMLR